ncbi:DNA polymerase-3 subunit epsilon [Rhodothalassium salexigens DSM 2132]|uniref:DNA polymerase III subunit epsilon n=1 Tax=Rhodothalassium salexigens DSM 2132 TaxID=1188247 RepID=A0A4R2PL53_RHOSA|nr:DNA polymerase III subunit epsilon [Rhodothalassium salexigens]MBB4211177.1 DNA polymerase-3 subunit epsilon [Rhodothalassium salexigens DSM 2132]MBK1637518.1 DNA polymerase III subunit epsilon [Rhodothalassium salexigens DSM 2132]TCP36167.1 DNA polymerase-3 subunit epsilon [Rhodothalassium salexigens DSM 2132]
MREIVFDTETTGFDPNEGHRLIEIGCVEIRHGLATGETFHVYLNPERDVPEEAVRVHGLRREFLADKPLFADMVDRFLDFVGDTPLVAHNASFDRTFINAELAKAGRPTLPSRQFVDTLEMAKRKFPGQRNSLDALCERLGVSNARRDLHGALLDAEILAEVYLELQGGRQRGLELVSEATRTATVEVHRPHRAARPHAPSDEEAAAHAAFLDLLTDPIWRRDGG